MVERGLRTRRGGFFDRINLIGKIYHKQTGVKQESVPHIANKSAFMDIAV